MNKQLKWVSVVLAGLFFWKAGLGQELRFAVNGIPPELRESAEAVTRYSHTRILVTDPRKMILQVKKAVTVLSPRGEYFGVAHVFYDKSRKIADLSAEIYDASGSLVRRVKQKEFSDQSAVSDISIFEDTRVKFFNPPTDRYPYTVYYQYEVRRDDTHYFSDWFPTHSPLVSVQEAVYEVVCGPGFAIRTKEMYLPAAGREVTPDGSSVYRWHVKNLAACGEQPFAPPPRSFLPHVLIAPVNFRYKGMDGRFNNWEEYGRWVYQHLLEGRDEVPEATAEKVRTLVAGLSDEREKVERIYRFVQEKNRYVSIQVGIGGLQPMQAAEVDRLSYGDCKGLVNYTKALLSVAGIPSIYTEVAAGEEQRSYLAGFASFLQGNHVILCVPLQGDTVWLECTSKVAPFNYLGTFTSDRNVLLITPGGGKITRTPSMEGSYNRRSAVFDLHESGEASVRIETEFSGIFYFARHALARATPRQARQLIQELYPLPNLEIESWEVAQPEGDQPLTREQLNLRARGFTNWSGDRLFLPLNPLNRLNQLPGRITERKVPVWIPESYTEEGTFEFRITDGFGAEYLPDNTTLTLPFGFFSVRTRMEEGKLIYRRVLCLNKGYYPPATAEKINEFFREVYRADAQKAVLTMP